MQCRYAATPGVYRKEHFQHIISLNSKCQPIPSLCIIIITASVIYFVLQEGFDGQMTEDNIEIGICNSDGFRRLNPSEVKDYLAAIL